VVARAGTVVYRNSLLTLTPDLVDGQIKAGNLSPLPEFELRFRGCVSRGLVPVPVPTMFSRLVPGLVTQITSIRILSSAM